MQTVVAGLIIQDGKILITRRAPGKELAGYWEFPGGKLEMGEVPENALVREIQEELGIEITVGNMIGRQRHGEILLMVYWALLEYGEPVLKVHDQMEWVRVEDLARFNFAPADQFVLERLRSLSNRALANYG